MRRRTAGRGTLALAGALALYFFSLTIADPDLWGHVRFGQDVLATGAIVRPDPYSFLSGDQLWIDHEWLAEVAFAWVYDALGAPGLIALKTALALLLLGLALRHLGGWGGGQAVALAAAAGLLLPWLANVRPQIFTYLGVLLLLSILDGAERGRVRRLWWTPALLAVWVNLHGGVIAGVTLLLLWCVAHTIRASTRGAPCALGPRGLLPPVAISLLALLANPYGARLPMFLLTAATVPRPDIAEWAPIDLPSPYGAAWLAVVVVAAVALRASRLPRPVPSLLLLAGTAVAPLLAVRHTPLFAIAFAVLAGPHVVDGWARATAARPLPTSAGLRRAASIVAALAASALVALSLPHFRCIHVRAHDMPAAAIALMRDSGVRGALAIYFDWGQYAIWHLGPRVRVSDDGRRETVYSPRVRALNDRFTAGLGRWDDLLAAGQVDAALVSTRVPAVNLMKRKPGWRLVEEDAGWALFAREGSAAMAQLEEAPRRSRQAEPCWPGGAPMSPRDAAASGARVATARSCAAS